MSGPVVPQGLLYGQRAGERRETVQNRRKGHSQCGQRLPDEDIAETASSLPKRVSPERVGALVLQPVPRYNLIMQHTYEEVRQIACALPEDQRVLLANSLWESVGSDTETPAAIEAAWDGEIKRRLDEIDSGAVELVPLEDVLARMDARLLARQHG